MQIYLATCVASGVENEENYKNTTDLQNNTTEIEMTNSNFENLTRNSNEEEKPEINNIMEDIYTEKQDDNLNENAENKKKMVESMEIILFSMIGLPLRSLVNSIFENYDFKTKNFTKNGPKNFTKETSNFEGLLLNDRMSEIEEKTLTNLYANSTSNIELKSYYSETETNENASEYTTDRLTIEINYVFGDKKTEHKNNNSKELKNILGKENDYGLSQTYDKKLTSSKDFVTIDHVATTECSGNTATTESSENFFTTTDCPATSVTTAEHTKTTTDCTYKFVATTECPDTFVATTEHHVTVQPPCDDTLNIRPYFCQKHGYYNYYWCLYAYLFNRQKYNSNHYCLNMNFDKHGGC